VFGSQNSYGAGCDIVITEKCNQNRNNFSDLGGTYEAPKGMKAGSKEAREFLAGEYKFRVREIEVFKVKFLL
jgi:hypothetical protein